MAVFKCKMCGGSLEISAGTTVSECEYCGTMQTIPRLDDDKRENFYDRANHYRRNNEFDKAAGIYEQILNEDSTDAEAYWSLVLCRYGIEYVEDPASRKRIPTVNRAQYTSIFDDDNYKLALKYSIGYQRTIYEEEARVINEIQKGILAISQQEEPFDIFICYKESDENGRRTHDSVLAQDLYFQLKQEGFKVFFARITLENKLGTAYEPYIFAALNSSKAMVVVGTKPEYFNAVWVKNEWSRYLALIKQGEKKVLIPAYKDMDPYNLPEEFSHLQAQDMSKLGFMQDLVRGIKKIVKKEDPKAKEPPVTIQIPTSGNANAVPLLRRARDFVEFGQWDKADEYCEKVLDIDPTNGEAYLYKLLTELEINSVEKLPECEEPFDDSHNYQQLIRYADENLRNNLIEYNYYIRYSNATKAMNQANEYLASNDITKLMRASKCFKVAADIFAGITNYRDSAYLADICYGNSDVAAKDHILFGAKAKLVEELTVSEYDDIICELEPIRGWRDTDAQIYSCQVMREGLRAKQDAKKRERENQRLMAEKAARARIEQERRSQRISSIIGGCVAGAIALIIILAIAL